MPSYFLTANKTGILEKLNLGPGTSTGGILREKTVKEFQFI